MGTRSTVLFLIIFKMIKGNIIKYTAILFITVLMSTVPMKMMAQEENVKLDYSGLVQCDGVVTPGEEGRTTKCNFQSLMAMIDYLIKWVFGITVPIFVGLCAYAGWLYMQPSSSDRAKANTMLLTALKGFAIMLMSWFIVTTLVKWVINPKLYDTATSLLDTKK